MGSCFLVIYSSFPCSPPALGLYPDPLVDHRGNSRPLSQVLHQSGAQSRTILDHLLTPEPVRMQSSRWTWGEITPAGKRVEEESSSRKIKSLEQDRVPSLREAVRVQAVQLQDWGRD